MKTISENKFSRLLFFTSIYSKQ